MRFIVYRYKTKLTIVQTLLNCIDNSGAAIVECIQVVKMKKAAGIGRKK